MLLVLDVDGDQFVVRQPEFVAESIGRDQFELILVVMGPFGGDDVCALIALPVSVLDGRGVADGGTVGPVVVLPAVDVDRVESLFC